MISLDSSVFIGLLLCATLFTGVQNSDVTQALVALISPDKPRTARYMLI